MAPSASQPAYDSESLDSIIKTPTGAPVFHQAEMSMNRSSKLRRCLFHFLLLNFAVSSLILPTAQAGMIGTTQLAADQQAMSPSTNPRIRPSRLLQRERLATQLETAGLALAQAQARVAALTDDEVSVITDRLNQLPAGGDVLGMLMFLFLVLLATDIAGYTEIFPFVKRTATEPKTDAK